MSDIPANWSPMDGPKTRKQLLHNARRGWYVNLAQHHKIVPAPDAPVSGKIELARTLLGDLFTTDGQVQKFIGRCPLDIVLAHWSERLTTPMTIRFPGRRVWLPVLVNSSTENGAAIILKRALPDIEIKGEDQ